MDKVSLAKKTAKLMVAKLSPQELENELYQLLIMLPDSDIDYVRDDIEKGNIAGTPGPMISMGTEDYDLSRSDSMHQYEDEEEDAVLTEDKVEDVQEMLEKSLDKEVQYEQDMNGTYLFFIDLSNMLNSESAYAIMLAIDEDDDTKFGYSISKIEPENDDDDILMVGSTKEFDKVLKALEKGVKQNRDEILNTPRYGDEEDAKDSDEIDEIISKMYSETLTFEKYLEDSDLVSEVDIDSMSGVVNIYWTDVQMGGYITQATPFWADVDDIPIQVETTDGVLIDNGGNPVNVHFHTSEYIEEGFLQFMRAYYDKLPEILAKSKDIVDRYEGFQEDQSGGMDDINDKTDKALEQWSLEGAESLTDEQKDLIYGTNGVHTDYGWNEVVSEFITTYAKPEYQSTSLDEIPFGGFDISENEEEDFRSQLNEFVNEFEKEEYMVSDYYLPNLQPREFNL